MADYPVSVVQSITGSINGTSISVTLPAAPTFGNLLVCIAAGGSVHPGTPGYKWHPIASAVLSSTDSIMAYARRVGASESATVVVTGVSTLRECAVYELTTTSGGYVMVGPASSVSDTASTSHPQKAIDALTGYVLAAIKVTTSGGSTTVNNAWTNGFVREHLVSDRLETASKTLASPEAGCTTTETLAAAKASSLCMVNFVGRPVLRPMCRQYQDAATTTNPYTMTLDEAPVAGNLMVLAMASATTSLGTTPTGWTLRSSAISGDSTTRVTVYTKVAGVSESTSITTDATNPADMWFGEFTNCVFGSSVGQANTSSTSMATGTVSILEVASYGGIVLAFGRSSTSGGGATPQCLWTGGFSQIDVVNAAGIRVASRHILAAESGITTTETLSVAKVSATVILSLHVPLRTAAAAYDAAVFADYPYAWWRLRDAVSSTVAADSSGNGRPSGTAAAPITFGKTDYLAPNVDQTASIDGAKRMYTPWDRSEVSNNWTVEAWVRPSGTINLPGESNSGTAVADPGTFRWLFYPQQGGSNAGVGVAVGTNGVVVAEHGDSHAPAVAVYTGTLVTDRLSQLVVVCNAKQYLIYLNGTLVRTGTTSTKTNVWLPSVLGNEGSALNSNNLHMNGNVSNVSWYNSVLTAARIKAHYDTMRLWEPRSDAPMVMG